MNLRVKDIENFICRWPRTADKSYQSVIKHMSGWSQFDLDIIASLKNFPRYPISSQLLSPDDRVHQRAAKTIYAADLCASKQGLNTKSAIFNHIDMIIKLKDKSREAQDVLFSFRDALIGNHVDLSSICHEAVAARRDGMEKLTRMRGPRPDIYRVWETMWLFELVRRIALEPELSRYICGPTPPPHDVRYDYANFFGFVLVAGFVPLAIATGVSLGLGAAACLTAICIGSEVTRRLQEAAVYNLNINIVSRLDDLALEDHLFHSDNGPRLWYTAFAGRARGAPRGSCGRPDDTVLPEAVCRNPRPLEADRPR